MTPDETNPDSYDQDEPSQGCSSLELVTAAMLNPGGKVDRESVYQAYQDARDQGDDEFILRVKFTLMRDIKDRLDRYLTTRIKFMSRNQLQNLIDSGVARVNDRTAKSSTKLRVGDQIELVIPPPPSGKIEGDNIPLDVLYEDAHILVLNKQSDIIVHPARSENRGTMLNALVYYFEQHASGELSTVGEEFARPGVVHRLDRHTSGCIVFAKTDEAHWKMGSRFEMREVDKRYLAVVEGWVDQNVQLIDLPLGPHFSHAKGSREKRIVRYDHLGKPSQTICRVRERFELPPQPRKSATQKYSLVELELLTGRTHQIRVHLSHLGHPIVGDNMYDGKPLFDTQSENQGDVIIDRQALHAALISFDHPITSQHLEFVAPLRDELGALITHLRIHGNPVRTQVSGIIPDDKLGI